MTVIDIHRHFGRLGIDMSESFSSSITASLSDFPCWRRPSSKGWTAKDLEVTYEENIEDMDKAGIDKCFLVGNYFYNPDFPEYGWVANKNEYTAEAQNKYPDRIIGFASVDPRGGALAALEIDRAINELGLKGIGEFGAAYSGLALDDPILDPIYRKCEELSRERGTPLLIHAGMTYMPWTYLEIQDPARLWHVLEKFPELKIQIAHAGFGGSWDHALHLAAKWPNVYLDFTFTTSTYPPFKIMEFLQQAKWAGVLDRCLWGTDYPWQNGASDLAMYRKFPAESKRLGREPFLTDEDINGVLGENAKKLLGIK
jgi:predicted TIM-barrel fold metal-dependent hydrolase